MKMEKNKIFRNHISIIFQKVVRTAGFAAFVFVTRYFSKGSMIVVVGRLQIRPWVDKDGNKRRSAEIVADSVYFGESKKSKEESSQTTVAPNFYANAPYYSPYGSSFNTNGVKPAVSDFAMLDDDDAQLPF